MARPQKTGLEYFPLDVHLSDEVYAIECAYGNDGFAVIIKAWQALYQTDTGEVNCSSSIRRITMAKRANVEVQRWVEIIEACVEIGIFDAEAWSRGALTSNGVKKRLERVVAEREEGRRRASRRYSGSPDGSPDSSLPDPAELSGSYSPDNSTGNPTEKAAQNATKERKGKKRKVVQSSEVRGSAEGDEAQDVPADKPLDNPGFSLEFMRRSWPFYLKCKPGKGYRNRESQEVALRQLFRWSGGDEEEARAAMGYSIANGYQGLNWYFEHKQRSRNGNDSDAKHRQRAQHAAAFDRLIEQARAREAAANSAGFTPRGIGADPGGQGAVVHGRAGAVILQLPAGKAAAEG